MYAGFCQSMARNLTVQEVAAAAAASTWLVASCFIVPAPVVITCVRAVDSKVDKHLTLMFLCHAVCCFGFWQLSCIKVIELKFLNLCLYLYFEVQL